MNTSDPKIKELLQSALDLSNKCSDDVSKAIGRNLDLGQGQADGLFITMGAPVIASMFVMGLMTEPAQLKKENKLSNEVLSGRCLFASLFCWACRAPKRAGRVKVDEVLREIVPIWEFAMGERFDPSWLLNDLAKHCGK